MSQSFNTTRVGACVDAMHINEVGGLVPILHIAEFVPYCRLVPNLCAILNYLTNSLYFRSLKLNLQNSVTV